MGRELRYGIVIGVLFALCFFSTSIMRAQASRKALFTDYPPYLCIGGGFVAMAGIGHNDPLVVVLIDVNGVEKPQIIPTGDAVRGMLCSASHIELLVQDYKSDRWLVPLYTVEWRSRSRSTIHEDGVEELNVPRAGRTPPAIAHRWDSLEWQGNRAGGFARGDWYVWVPQVVDRPNNTYEVHFVRTEIRHRGGGATSKLVVDLLEETLDRKVTKSVPLVNIVAEDVGD